MVMSRIVASMLVVVVMLGSSGCVLRQVDSGAERTETREFPNFDSVDFSGFGRLEVEQSDEFGMELTGTETSLDRVVTEVRGDTLYIHHRTRWAPWFWDVRSQRLDIRLTVPELSRLTVAGAGEVTVDALEGDEFRFDISGAGDFTARDIDVRELRVTLSGAGSVRVSGSAEDQSVTISGAGNYDARDLESDTVRVDLSGASSATVWATESLDIKASGASSVDYYGDPEVSSDMSGAGSVTARGER